MKNLKNHPNPFYPVKTTKGLFHIQLDPNGQILNLRFPSKRSSTLNRHTPTDPTECKRLHYFEKKLNPLPKESVGNNWFDSLW